jgi:hypothetical protein
MRIIIADSSIEEDDNAEGLKELCTLMAVFGFKTKILTQGCGSTMIYYVKGVTNDELIEALMEYDGIDRETASDYILMRAWKFSKGDCSSQILVK